MGFPGGSEVKASASNVGDLGSIPGLGRSPGEGNGNPLQYSCLENPMDRGAWRATVHGVAKSRTRLSDFTSLHFNTISSSDENTFLSTCLPNSLQQKGKFFHPLKRSLGLIPTFLYTSIITLSLKLSKPYHLNYL